MTTVGEIVTDATLNREQAGVSYIFACIIGYKQWASIEVKLQLKNNILIIPQIIPNP